jgi:hypothetical protein
VGSGPFRRRQPRSRGPSATSPPAVRSLPGVTSSDATVRSLWQVDQLAEPVVVDDAVIGVVRSAALSVLHAVSAATGKGLWAFALPVADPQTLALIAAQSVVIAETGREVNSGPSGGPIITELVALDARSGAHLWSERVGARTQNPPVAIAANLVVLGDPVGTLVARNARTGGLVWQRSRPPACPKAGPVQYDEGVAADGALLVASYQCATHGNHGTVVQRLDVSDGMPLWQWSTPELLAADDKWLTTVAAAASGNVVVLEGQIAPNAQPFAAALPRPTRWPSVLAPVGGIELLVALDAHSGHARWTELGGQQEQIILVDGAVCEIVSAGFECRDDLTGAPSRPVFTSGYGQSAISPYYPSDGLAGISGDTAAAVTPNSTTDSVSVNVMPLRGTNTVAHLKVDVGTTTADGSRYDTFVVGSSQLANGATLVFLRRIDIKTYPLLAISVTPDVRTAKK